MCTMVYHCLPFTTVYHGCTMVLFHKGPLCGHLTGTHCTMQQNRKILIIIFTEWQMIFKSMHQCGKNQMAQYLAMAVQYFNYWSLLLNYRMPDTVTLVTFVCTYYISCIFSMVQNMRSIECGSHVNNTTLVANNTTLVFSCWPQGSATATWNGGKWIGMKNFNKKLLKCEKIIHGTIPWYGTIVYHGTVP